VSAATTGIDAHATANVRPKEDGWTVSGRSADTGTRVASARACVDAFNRPMMRHAKARGDAGEIS
jgi:2-isopropylmalate synthase